MLDSILRYPSINRMGRQSLALAIILLGTISCTECNSFGRDALSPGAGVYEFVLDEANDEKLNVWYYLPRDFAKDGQVLVVMHGVKRNADVYRDNWIDLAEKYHLLIIAPEFSLDLYPETANYQHGNVLTSKGKQVPRERWTLSLIDRIFEELVKENELQVTSYAIFGHSGGGQFVHRMMLLYPEAKVHLAMAANAGWYTLPEFESDYPYGLAGTPTDSSRLAAALAQPLVVLLGEDDTDPNHIYLNRSKRAMTQGDHRLARGQNFYRKAQEAATKLGCDFRWQLVTIPHVGHDNAAMALAAAKLIANRPPDAQE